MHNKPLKANHFMSHPLSPLCVCVLSPVARLRGEGREALAYAVVRRLCVGAAVVGVGLIPLLYYACVPLVGVLGACEVTLTDAVAYYRMRSLGAPAILLNAVAAGALR